MWKVSIPRVATALRFGRTELRFGARMYQQRGRRPTYVYFDNSGRNGYGYGNQNNGRWSFRDMLYGFRNMDPHRKRIVYGCGGAVALFLVLHIQQAPVTHRYRLMITAEWIENMVTNSSFEEVMQQYGAYVLPKTHPISRQVSSIMVRLISAAHDYRDPDTGEHINLFTYLGKTDIPLADWEYYVIDDVRMGQPSPNAFVIGGGKVFIFKSILPICQDEDGLATVLSHELGHLLADHMGEKLTLSPIFMTLNLIMFSIFGSTQPGNILINSLLNTGFSREMETEADYIGLMVMSKACFNPHKAPNLWKNMLAYEQKVGQKVPELLSTHPSSDRRFHNISEWMPIADRVYENSECAQMAGFSTFGSLFR